jgi:hypothetical protein
MCYKMVCVKNGIHYKTVCVTKWYSYKMVHVTKWYVTKQYVLQMVHFLHCIMNIEHQPMD